MARSIVMGYDDSPGAQAALDTALEIARAYGDKLVIAYGYEPPGHMGEEFKQHQAAVRELAEKATAKALERARAESIEAEVALVSAGAAEALIQAAEENDGRCIVVGTYGESPLKGALVGSTPHKLLQLATVPVVVVPAKDA